MNNIWKPEILFIASSYPSCQNHQAGIFLHSLVQEIVSQGITAEVIAPQSLWERLRPEQEDKIKNAASVIRPLYLSFSNKVLTQTFSTYRFTAASFLRSAKNQIKKIKIKPDIVYAHFLYPGGAAAAAIGKRLGCKAVAALGEGNLAYYEKHIGLTNMKLLANELAGIICVSQDNCNYCKQVLNVPAEKILFLPNAADITRFFPRDRKAMREKLGLPLKQKIVIYVGHFNHNKGVNRVVNALDKCDNVFGVFLGSGKLKPGGKKILYQGLVSQNEIPEWLSAADVFVLPTIQEASSNSLAEALACGLPAIASNIASVKDMTDKKCVLLVEPLDEEKIAEAIRQIFATPDKLQGMSTAALDYSKKYNLNTRAKKICTWLQNLLK